MGVYRLPGSEEKNAILYLGHLTSKKGELLTNDNLVHFCCGCSSMGKECSYFKRGTVQKKVRTC